MAGLYRQPSVAYRSRGLGLLPSCLMPTTSDSILGLQQGHSHMHSGSAQTTVNHIDLRLLTGNSRLATGKAEFGRHNCHPMKHQKKHTQRPPSDHN